MDKKIAELKLKLSLIHYRWAIAILFGIIILILTYKFWGKPAPLENLISIGSGLVSIALALVAIIYAFTESVRSNLREGKLDTILDRILHITSQHKNDFDKFRNDYEEQLIAAYANGQPQGGPQEGEPQGGGPQGGPQVGPQQPAVLPVPYPAGHYSPVFNTEPNILLRDPNIIKELNFIKIGSPLVVNGSIFIAEVNGKNRRVLVVQNDLANKYSPNIIVVELTTNLNIPSLPTHVKAKVDNVNVVILVERMYSISKNELLTFVSQLNGEDFKNVQEAIKILFGLK